MARKEKEIKEFQPHFMEDYKEVEFTPAEVPGLNTSQINAGISIEGGFLQSVVAGTNISIDNSDPRNPIINNTYTP